MSFLGKFTFNETALPSGSDEESYNIFQRIFDYNHGQFKDHDNEIIIEDGVENYSDNDVDDYMQSQNDAEYIRLLKDEKIVLNDIIEDGQIDKYHRQLEFIRLVKSQVKYLIRTSGNKLPTLQGKKRKSKQDEFLDNFNILYSNPSVTEEVVKETIYNKSLYSNPSELMNYVRKKRNLTTEQIKRHSAFRFLGNRGRPRKN